MKIFKFMAVALVAMLGFTACDKECGHDFIEYDHSKDLVGTWTCLTENYAEALVINADGSVVSTGIENGRYWEDVRGNLKTVNNKMTMTFEDDDNWEGRFEMVAGVAFSIYEENGESFTFRYCTNDLAEEIVGMWVCNDGPASGNKMTIQTFKENGKAIFTGFGSYADVNLVNDETSYKVIGDLLFYSLPKDKLIEGASPYITLKLSYSPNGTAYGDIMGQIAKKENEGEVTSSWLRIKQYLELPGMKYDYIKTFVSNVKGEDKDIPFLNTSFNFAKMDGSIIDKFLKSILFTVEFPDAEHIAYNFLLEGQNFPMTAPIEVDGNKMTIKMSVNNPAYHDIDVDTFQDQDNTQMHMYMHTTAFEKFFANTSVAVMLGHGQLSQDDTEAIAGVYQTIAEAVESINLSLVMTKAAK